jgi:hypothetical protein
MSKNWIAANVLLLIAAGLLGRQVYVSATRFHAENDLAKLVPVGDVKQRISAEGELPPLPPPRRYNPAEFAVIPNQNLFSDTRAREEKADEQPVREVPPLNIKPVLVGITISGNKRQALIIDPSSAPQGRQGQSSIKKLGDVYQGYTITDITESQMVLENGPRREIIPLYDGSKHTNNAGKTPIIATRVVPFQAGGAGSGGGAPVIVGGQPTVVAAGPSRPSQSGSGSGASSGGGTSVSGAPAMIPNSARETPTPIGSARGIIRPGQQQQQQQQSQPSQWTPSTRSGAAFNEGTDEQGRRVIRTPFGDIVQPQTKPPNP